MWAILGRRSPDQRALTWRQALASNIEFMGKVNYPRKARLRRHAAEVGAEIAFLEKQELLLRDFGKAGRVVSRAKRLGLGRLLAGVFIAPPGNASQTGGPDGHPSIRRYALFTLVGIAGEDDLDAPDGTACGGGSRR
jgi:hypothetical protein